MKNNDRTNREKSSASDSPIPSAWWGNRQPQSAPPAATLDSVKDGKLVQQAREFNRTMAPGLAGFEAHYARFHPVLRTALARETVRLARIAGVRECAAFMALVRQFEN